MSSLPQPSITSHPPEPPNLIGSRANRRREKPQLSCNLCRRRKLKCDRNAPCSTCKMRGLTSTCTYQTSSGTPSSRPAVQEAGPLSMQDRIGQLENLVMSLKSSLQSKQTQTQMQMQNANVVTTVTPPAEFESETGIQVEKEVLDGVGRISLENEEMSYVESAHWTAILDEISELKDHFETDPVVNDPEPDLEGSGFPFGPCKSATKEEILMAMPPREDVDRLVARYFQDEVAHGLIHSTTFLKQYENFWASPQETPIMWIGLLFCIISLSTTNISLSSPSSSPPTHQTTLYHTKITQCLTLGTIHRPLPHTLDTLILYMNTLYHSTPTPQTSIWILLGIIVRLALRTGLHRDGSHFPRLSPYEVEMRRRKWSIITLWDRVTSIQVGLPSMIKISQSDTLEPSNLLDTDFSSDMTEPPTPRPEGEHTHMQFLVFKNRLMAVFSSISEHITQTTPRTSTYADVIALDTLLTQTYTSIPPTLKTQPISLSLSLTDPSALFIRRLFLTLVYAKAQCTLHRKYLRPARTEKAFQGSRKICLEAALEICRCQEVVERECCEGGRLERERWKVGSVVRGEFLLATTVLCLDLDWEIRHLGGGGREGSAEGVGEGNVEREGEDGCPTREQVVAALTTSYHIWNRDAETSKEAKRAATVVGILLSKIHAQSSPPPISSSIPPDPTTEVYQAQTYPVSIPLEQSQFQFQDIDDFSNQHSIPVSQDQPMFNMESWLPPDIEGGNNNTDGFGFGYYPDMTSDPYDMANWGLGDDMTGGMDTWNGFDGLDEFGQGVNVKF